MPEAAVSPVCNHIDTVSDLKRGIINVVFEGISEQDVQNKKDVLHDVFADLYYNQSGTCDHFVQAVELKGIAPFGGYKEEAEAASISTYVNTFWVAEVSCVSCPDGDPMFEL